MTNNCRNWIHYIELRTTEGTQKEHRDIANAIKDVFIKEWPIVAEALEWK
jgi:thymidylate synthase (FAD)